MTGRFAAVHEPLPEVPRWAVRAAWAIQLCVLPSSLWRILVVALHIPLWDGEAGSGDLPWWLPLELYVVLLSLISELLALTAFGLICRWGEVWPRWVPLLRGRGVPRMVAVVPAATGALGLTLLWTWTTAMALFDRNVRMEEQHDSSLTLDTWEGAVLILSYLPLVAWDPLLAALTVHYYRRRRAPRSSAAAGRPPAPTARRGADASSSRREPARVPSDR
jgi:hypothetical protein